MFVIRLLRTIVLAVATLAATLASGIAGAFDDEVAVSEYVTLPKFCWFQFSGGKTAELNLGPEASVVNCGVHMNHYCFGLLDLQRSKKAKTLDVRKMLLGRARTNTLYTLNGMKGDGTTETCNITPHVQATMRDINLQMQIYNMKSR